MRLVVLGLALAAAAAAQNFSQRGFLDVQTFLYPQAAVNDSGHVVSEALLRWEGNYRASPNWTVYGGFDARTDTHHQVERTFRLDWQDRGLQRPAISLRRASVSYHRGGWNAEVGKQFIRWGRADILNPTDRFAPKDFLNVANSDFLGVTAGRVSYERGSHTIEAVAAPWFTPARIPLINQRWSGIPPEAAGIPIRQIDGNFPGRTQFGLRWSRVSARCEYSLMFYDGFHYLPLFEGRLAPGPLAVEVQPLYPTLRQYGGDVTIPLRWFSVKGEAAWYGSRTKTADEYGLYVIQLERTWGEWVLVGGYSGEVVTSRRNPAGFAPDRGMARAFLGRASYTIDPRRTLAFEAAIRQNGDGVWLKGEYTQQFGRHWRAVAAFTLIRGDTRDFIGQYRQNSHGLIGLRYSF